MANAQSISKDSFQKKITVDAQNISLEDLLRQLSKQTSLYFIYGSNSINSSKLVTLNLRQRPLHEVLETVGKEMNLSFRREGVYVIVKATPVILTENKSITSTVSHRPAVQTASLKLDPFPVTARTAKYLMIDRQPAVSYDLIKKNLLYCTSVFSGIDTTSLKKYLPLSITNPHPNRVVFTSIGLMANEYYGGVEIHLGIPSLYGVLNTGMMRGGYFRYGYGVGTSIPLKPMIALNPVYTFASVKQEYDYVADGVVNLTIKDGLKVEGKHHQIKLLLQFQPFKKIRMYAGPSFNFLKSTYTFQKFSLVYSEFVTIPQTSAPSGYYSPPGQIGIVRSTYYTAPSDFDTNKSWVGFEAGISYIIKFSHR